MIVTGDTGSGNNVVVRVRGEDENTRRYRYGHRSRGATRSLRDRSVGRATGHRNIGEGPVGIEAECPVNGSVTSDAVSVPLEVVSFASTAATATDRLAP
jgi:hypothetical protein